MEKLSLKRLSLEDKTMVLDYIKEMVIYGSQMDGIWYEQEANFETMLAKIEEHSQTKFENYEQTVSVKFQYLLIRATDNHLVGMVSIRPFLTRKLDESYGGNIGYSIRPTERQKGYATEGLHLAIKECQRMNPSDAVMVCCNAENIVSKKAILKNGGRLVAEKSGIISKEKYLIG